VTADPEESCTDIYVIPPMSLYSHRRILVLTPTDRRYWNRTGYCDGHDLCSPARLESDRIESHGLHGWAIAGPLDPWLDQCQFGEISSQARARIGNRHGRPQRDRRYDQILNPRRRSLVDDYFPITFRHNHARGSATAMADHGGIGATTLTRAWPGGKGTHRNASLQVSCRTG